MVKTSWMESAHVVHRGIPQPNKCAALSKTDLSDIGVESPAGRTLSCDVFSSEKSSSELCAVNIHASVR